VGYDDRGDFKQQEVGVMRGTKMEGNIGGLPLRENCFRSLGRKKGGIKRREEEK